MEALRHAVLESLRAEEVLYKLEIQTSKYENSLSGIGKSREEEIIRPVLTEVGKSAN